MTVAKNSRGGGGATPSLASEGLELARQPLSIPRDAKLARWGEGPWLDECDWQDGRSRGVLWLLRRGPMGTWCGYVGVPSGHPWHGVAWGEIDASAHGGLTFSAGASDGLWWIGFDCGHAYDYTPGLAAARAAVRERNPELGARLDALERLTKSVETYRDYDFALSEVVDLAEQAAAAATGAGAR